MMEDCPLGTDEKVCAVVKVVEARLDGLEKKVDEVKAAVEKQNSRVAKLEGWRNLIVGGLFIMNLLVGWFAKDLFGRMDEVYRFYIQSSLLHRNEIKSQP